MTTQVALGIGSFVLILTGTLMLSTITVALARYASPGEPLRRESERRALVLLRNWLSPAQLDCYERYRYFDVVGSETGTTYRIHHGIQANIDELGRSGRLVCKWCFVPEGNLAAGDVMLAQKISLETNERDALAVANRSLTYRGDRI